MAITCCFIKEQYFIDNAHFSKMIQNTLNFRYRNVFQKASIKNCLLTYLQSKPNLDSVWLVL